MTTIAYLPKDAPFEQQVKHYRGLAKISPSVVSGREIKAMALDWLKLHGVSPHSSPRHTSKRKNIGAN
jgi:hypothetical protein